MIISTANAWWISAILLLSAIQYIPYFVSMRRGTTKPSISGWIVYSLSLFLIIVSSVSSRSYSAVFVGSIGLLCQLAIIVLGIASSSQITFSTFERVCVSISLCSAAIWWWSGDADVALYANVGIDAIGTILIAMKTAKNPATEDSLTWLIGTAAAAFNLVVFFDLSLTNMLFPAYLLLSNLLIFMVSSKGCARLRRSENQGTRNVFHR